MGQRTTEAMESWCHILCIYRWCNYLTNAIRRVRGVEWLDLGIPEAMYLFPIGPLSCHRFSWKQPIR